MDKTNHNSFARRHPILTNVLVILLVAFIGLYLCYISFALFTKHGKSDTVPGVENMSYTQAISILHDHGFRVDIRDSLYKDDVKPGFVIEQYPKANSVVKPGRKIFLYINAVHPKEVIIDDDNHPNEYAFKGFSFRQGMAKLEELGFKNVRVVRVLGDTDRIVKVLANGKTVRKMQKVPVNANIVVEVYDGRLDSMMDSLSAIEFMKNRQEYSDTPSEYEPSPNYIEPSEPSENENEESEYL